MKKFLSVLFGSLFGLFSAETIASSTDSPPTLHVENATVNESGGPMIFSIVCNPSSPRCGSTNQPLSLDYTTQDGTATANSDYVPTRGTLTLAPGQSEGFVTVTIKNDSVPEKTETFTLDLLNPVNAKLDKQQVTGTIIDDDTE